MKKLIPIFLFLGLIFWNRSKEFHFAKAHSDHVYPFDTEIQTPPACLNQPFHYLGKGVQFYVFVGEDDQTILKLFKHHHAGFSTDMIEKIFPKALARPLVKKREKRMQHLFTSAQIAHRELARETGVFYTHLAKSTSALGFIALHKKNTTFSLDLNKAEFVLQKRGKTAGEQLSTLLEKNEVPQAINAMRQMLDLIESRSKKGIKNKDGKILDNVGFIEDQAVELDIGSFVHRAQSANPDPHHKARLRAATQLLTWVKKNYPDKLQECKQGVLDETTL